MFLSLVSWSFNFRAIKAAIIPTSRLTIAAWLTHALACPTAAIAVNKIWPLFNLAPAFVFFRLGSVFNFEKRCYPIDEVSVARADSWPPLSWIMNFKASDILCSVCFCIIDPRTAARPKDARRKNVCTCFSTFHVFRGAAGVGN